MAFRNRAKMTTATVGQGTLTLGSASTGFVTFGESGAADGETVTYCIEDGNDFEVGRGVYTASGTTLTRATVLLSKIGATAGTTKLTLSGTATVFITAAAEDIQPLDSDLTAIAALTTTSFGRSLLAAANAAALATLAGLGTTDNPQFATIELGAAADTTISRVSAGVIAVEGSTILTAATGQPLDADLTSIAALTTTSIGRSLLAAASAAAIATIAGVGTGDSPQFTAVNIGAATDTTVTRTGAGDIAVEGNAIYRAGGTDVPVADGGTGSSTAAGAATNLGLGTGDSPQFTAVNIGNATDTTVSRSAAGVIAVEGIPLYSGIPQNSQSTAYTLVLADAQMHILHPTADNNARTFTIPANASVAYPVGTVITFVNQINTVTISITTDTLTLAGTGTTGSRTLAANGIATALKLSSTSWIISGVGLT